MTKFVWAMSSIMSLQSRRLIWLLQRAFSETSTLCIRTKRLQANPDSVDAFCTDHLPAPLLQRPLESIFQVPRSPILSTVVDFWLRLNLAIR